MHTWKRLTALILVILLLAVTPVAVAAANGGSAEPQTAAANAEGSSSLIWIILLCISLLGNVVQLMMLTWDKKDNSDTQIDDVPLVEYDIDDDVI